MLLFVSNDLIVHKTVSFPLWFMDIIKSPTIILSPPKKPLNTFFSEFPFFLLLLLFFFAAILCYIIYGLNYVLKKINFLERVEKCVCVCVWGKEKEKEWRKKKGINYLHKNNFNNKSPSSCSCCVIF